MQAYQSAPCPYCGVTWNPPGAQTCGNCRNPLPPPQAAYTPPGYAPGPPQGPPPSGPGQAPGYPYGAQNYPQPGYPQSPQQYPGAPAGYPGQPPQYPSYAPPGYPSGYPPQPGAEAQGYPSYAPAAAPAAPSTTLRLFGQSITVPVALPPALVQYQKQVVYGVVGVIALLIVLFGITPGLATSQITGGSQALITAASHQARVDAVFVQLIGEQSGSSDPNAMKAQFDKLATSFNDGLALVQSDEAALKSSDQRLSILQWVTPSKGAEIASERHRLAAALAGLQQADNAMTAGVNMEMTSSTFRDTLAAAVKNGSVKESTIDDSVRDILLMKYKLGLFTNPYISVERARVELGSTAQREAARAAAERSAVLLRNQGGALPLKKSVASIAVIGKTLRFRNWRCSWTN